MKILVLVEMIFSTEAEKYLTILVCLCINRFDSERITNFIFGNIDEEGGSIEIPPPGIKY